MEKPKNYDNSFRDFQARYLTKLTDQVKDFELTAESCELGTLSLEQLQDLRQKIHKLAGSGATFGFPDISEKAFQIEEAVDVHLDREADLSQAESEAIANLLRQFIETAKRAQLPALERDFPEVIENPLLKAPVALSDTKILLVDDDEILRNFLQGELEDQGYQCTCAQNGTEALSLLQKAQPDLIVLDIHMPDMTGIEVLEAIKRDQKTATIPIIMLTRNVDDTAIIKSISEGAQDYLTKPFEAKELVKHIKGIVEHHTTKILIVDDDEVIANLLKQRFYRMGYTVSVVDNGTTALEEIAKFKPDLCILDIMLPGLSGTSILRKIRLTPETADMPVIILSAKNQSENVLNHLESGANDYVTKPFDLDILSAKVSAILEREKDA